MADEMVCKAGEFTCKDLDTKMEYKDESNKILNDISRNREALIEKFTTERAEFRYDNILASISHLSEKQAECCCANKVAMAELNCKIDLQTANFEKALLERDLRQRETNELKSYIDMKFCSTGQFPLTSGQYPPATI